MYRRATELMEAEIGDELVALDPKQGDCFGFNPVAASVWRSLDHPKSFEQLRDELLAQFDVGEAQCASELRDLLDDMVARRLVEMLG
jgi:hypothetical protein